MGSMGRNDGSSFYELLARCLANLKAMDPEATSLSSLAGRDGHRVLCRDCLLPAAPEAASALQACGPKSAFGNLRHADEGGIDRVPGRDMHI